jgi:hypothetical protein
MCTDYKFPICFFILTAAQKPQVLLNGVTLHSKILTATQIPHVLNGIAFHACDSEYLVQLRRLQLYWFWSKENTVNAYLVIFVTRMFFATKQSRILVFHKCAQMRRTKRSGRTLDCCTKYRYLACYLNRPKWHQKVIIRRRRVDYWYAAAEPLFSRIRFHRFRIVQPLTRKKSSRT